jgi:acyl-coenzyme A synthetase/AMP-(fatty) acid ligase
VPREVVLVEALPKTGSGKIDRRALRMRTTSGDQGGVRA